MGFIEILFYLGVVIALILFLKMSSKIPIQRRLLVAILIPLIIVLLFIFISALFGLIVLVIFIALVFSLLKPNKLKIKY